MKKLLIGLTLLTSMSSFASDYMVLNVAEIHDTGIKNLIGLDGKGIGTIDCEKPMYNGVLVEGLRMLSGDNNGSINIRLKKDNNKILSIAENYNFQDEASCERAIELIESTASNENPVSLILDKSGINKVYISIKH